MGANALNGNGQRYTRRGSLYRCPYCRLFTKIRRRAGHWLWIGKKSTHGYGFAWNEGHPIHAHRFAWMLLSGLIGYEKHIYNLCGKRLCVRPQHWAQGTPSDYVYDWQAEWRKRGKEVKKRTHAFWIGLLLVFARPVNADTVIKVSDLLMQTTAYWAIFGPMPISTVTAPSTVALSSCTVVKPDPFNCYFVCYYSNGTPVKNPGDWMICPK